VSTVATRPIGRLKEGDFVTYRLVVDPKKGDKPKCVDVTVIEQQIEVLRPYSSMFLTLPKESHDRASSGQLSWRIRPSEDYRQAGTALLQEYTPIQVASCTEVAYSDLSTGKKLLQVPQDSICSVLNPRTDTRHAESLQRSPKVARENTASE